MFWCLNTPCLLAQAAAAEPPGDLLTALWFKAFLAFMIVAGSFIMGPVIARMLKMPDYGAKIGLLLFTLVASVAICILGWPPKRGIDLCGGVQLVYEVDTQEVEQANLESIVSHLNGSFKSGKAKLAAHPLATGKVEIFVP